MGHTSLLRGQSTWIPVADSIGRDHETADGALETAPGRRQHHWRPKPRRTDDMEQKRENGRTSNGWWCSRTSGAPALDSGWLLVLIGDLRPTSS